MTIFEIGALLLGLSAAFGFINHKWLKLPHTIGLVIIALLASGMIILADLVFPQFGITATVTKTLVSIDFDKTLMNGMLSFLLFAGAVHVDLDELAARKWAIGLMATMGVLTSTFLIGGAMWGIMQLAGQPVPFIWALVFGSLITPTDPVAVLGLLKTIKIPPLLKAKIAGESLFNDGVGVVVFTIMVALAVSSTGHGGDAANAAGGGHGTMDALGIAKLFVVEAGGGVILGIIGGMIAFWAMRQIDEHNIEVLITLALVMVIYAIAIRLHLSGPIAVVIAGLFIGNHGAKFAMSSNTRKHVFQFWELIDEILNSVLFLLIGLEVIVIGADLLNLPIALLAIPVAILARLISVSIPIGLLSIREKFETGSISILTWGGLRGGISVALALSLPDVPEKPGILAATYAVVVFSIIVQGLTMKKLVARFKFFD